MRVYTCIYMYIHVIYTYVYTHYLWKCVFPLWCTGVHSEADGRDAGVLPYLSTAGPASRAGHVSGLRTDSARHTGLPLPK